MLHGLIAQHTLECERAAARATLIERKRCLALVASLALTGPISEELYTLITIQRRAGVDLMLAGLLSDTQRALAEKITNP
jgi:hypothetical protein